MFYSYLRKKRMFILLFMAFLILLFFNNHWLGRWIYPIHYQNDIKSAATENKVDPFLISAITRVESNFKKDKISSKGAVGLMQIMPDTAHWIIDPSGTSEHGLIADRLMIPDVNIQVGTQYIGFLQKQFEQRLIKMESKFDRLSLVAAAYNAGPGNVNKWLDSGTWDGSYNQVNLIPFGETRHFVQRIIYYYKKHERYYAEIWYNGESS